MKQNLSQHVAEHIWMYGKTYTKLLQIKTNRMKDNKENNKDKKNKNKKINDINEKDKEIEKIE